MTTLENRPGAAPTDPSRVADLNEAAQELHRRREQARGGSPAAQHDRRKLTVWERLDILLDPDSFVEIEGLRRHRATEFGMAARRPPGDGVVTGWGTVDGRTVFVHAQDFRVYGGSLGRAHAEKIHKILDMAESTGAPVVALNDGGGARIQEGVTALAGFGGIFHRNVRSSGVIPQISVVLGPCAGGAAYSPALTDFVFMVRDVAQMFVTGPDVVRAVTDEEVSHEQLGGADVHAVNGVAGFVYDDEETCLLEVRHLLSLLPSNNRELPPLEPTADPADRRTEALLDIVPADPRQLYDVRAVIEEIVDDGDVLEYHEQWATNVVCGLTRIAGAPVGVVANQPGQVAGALDAAAAEKAARFVQTCDAFNVPLLTLVDVPGFLPGTSQEHGGIIRHGAKLLHAYCAATVPRIQVVLRKAYGGAYIVMDSRSIGADLSFAWPCNEIAVMGAAGAAEVLYRREIAAADDPEAVRAARTAEYTEQLMDPYHAAEHGLVDDVIDPVQTRRLVAQAFAVLRSKRARLPMSKHANPPL